MSTELSYCSLKRIAENELQLTFKDTCPDQFQLDFLKIDCPSKEVLNTIILAFLLDGAEKKSKRDILSEYNRLAYISEHGNDNNYEESSWFDVDDGIDPKAVTMIIEDIELKSTKNEGYFMDDEYDPDDFSIRKAPTALFRITEKIPGFFTALKGSWDTSLNVFFMD